MLASGKTSLLLKEKMTNGELKEYLNRFPDDAGLSIIIANPKERKLYSIENLGGIDDLEIPVLCIEVGPSKNRDAEMVAACEEDERNADYLEGQMFITDFPEVMP